MAHGPRKMSPSMARTGTWRCLGVSATVLLTSSLPAAAHGLGQRYELPVPLALYLTGAGLAVGFSFVLMAWFMRRNSSPASRTVELDGRVVSGPAFSWALRLLALAVFVLLIVIGLFGPQQSFKNITPIAVWVLWWVGFAYLTAFVGNLWPLVNPW